MSDAADRSKEILGWALIVLLVYLVYRVAGPFIAPLTWAVVLSIFFFPAHRWIESRIGRPSAAALLSALALVVLLVAPLAIVAPLFIGEAATVVRQLPADAIVENVQEAAAWIDERLPVAVGDIGSMTRDAATAIRNRAGAWSAKFAANFAGVILDSIVLVIALYFLFRDGRRIVELLRDVSPFGGERFDRMVHQTVEMISATITAGFVVALTQGTLGAASFAVLSLPSPIFWGVVTAVLSLIPFLGAWLVWAPAGIGLIIEGHVGRGVGLLALGFGLISTVDNFLRPLLISGRSQLNALLVFISVLGGIQAFGLLGVIVGPLVMATAVGLLTGYRSALEEESKRRGDSPEVD